VTISGGTVTAPGAGGAGIGSGYGGSGGTVTISGGTVTATGDGAGIGSGYGGSGGTVTISGGTVTATGDNGGAGIGGGSNGSGGTVTISGGTVTANGSDGGAGIGGGSGGSGGTVTISGGSVTATGGGGGAGIGGGGAGTTKITGGSVKAVDSSGSISVPGGVTDGNGHPEYLDTVTTTFGAGATVQASVNGGATSAVVTNTSGKLYFWLTGTGSAVVGNGSAYYSADVSGISGNVSGALSALQALDIHDGSITVTSSNITQAGNASSPFSINDVVIIGYSTANTVSVTGGTHNIVLRDAHIDDSNNSGMCAFSIASGASVNLTLDGANTLKSGSFRAGLQVPKDTSVTITGSNPSSDILTATGGDISAGIGGYSDSTLNNTLSCGGTITISGGTVNATGGKYNKTVSCNGETGTGSGAGIGGGAYFGSGGTVTINGGIVHAISGTVGPSSDGSYCQMAGAGIGGGSYRGSGGIVTINGGTVTANGGYNSAGIGSTYASNGGTTKIYGGTVRASGGESGAGIGGGEGGSGGTTEIYGGSVTANGSSGGAGIGGGFNGSGDTVTISGGSVTANGNIGGAGIGGGCYCSGGTVTISGGSVTANGSVTVVNGSVVGGAGIGGGYGSSAGSTVITGGSVSTNSISGTPTNGASTPAPVYLTTVTLPTGTAINSLAIKQGGTAYSYGYKDVQADGDHKLYLYLPANDINNTNDTTTADIVADGTVYTGYHGAVASGNKSVLKLEQSTLTITGTSTNPTYTYGSAINPSATGGTISGITYDYASTSGTVYPNVGSYTVTAKIAGNASYNDVISSSIPFTITAKPLTDGMVSTIAAQPFTDGQITPNVIVTDGTALTENKDYTKTYGTNISTGSSTGSVVVQGEGNYSGTITRTFAIDRLSLNVSLQADKASANAGGNVLLTATVTGALNAPAGTISFQDGSTVISSGAALTQSGSAYTATTTWSNVSLGNHDLTATYLPAATDNYTAGTNGAITAYNIVKQNQTGFKFTDSSITKTVANAPFTVAATGGQSTGGVTYAVTSGSDVATVDSSSGKVTLLKAGTAVITATKAADGNYNAATAAVTLTVLSPSISSATGVILDLTGVTLPAGVTSVSLGSSSLPQSADSGSTYSVVAKLIGNNESLGNLAGLTVYDLKLLDQNGNPITNFTGKIKVKIPVPAGFSGNLHVFWFNPADSTLTDMGATQENGYLVFETTHFSFYAIAQLNPSAPAPVANPKTGAEDSPVLPLALLGTGSLAGLVVVKRRMKFKKV